MSRMSYPYQPKARLNRENVNSTGFLETNDIARPTRINLFTEGVRATRRWRRNRSFDVSARWRSVGWVSVPSVRDLI